LNDNRFIISGSSDKTLKLWNLITGKCVRTFQGHINSVTSVDISNDDKFVISAESGDYDSLKLWNLSTGKCVRNFTGINHSSVKLSNDN
jgi:WD40 repeat protein